MEKDNLISEIKKRFAGIIERAEDSFGDSVLIVRPESVHDILQNLKSPPFNFDMLLDLTAVDLSQQYQAFEVVYHVYSLSRNSRLRLKSQLPASAPEIQSVVNLWKNANWLEREVFDMFGIVFKGHPYLRRILLYEGFEGYPLRKSYDWKKGQPLIEMKEKP